MNDEKVSVELGHQARHSLEALGCKVCWSAGDVTMRAIGTYKVPQEIDDVVAFLNNASA